MMPILNRRRFISICAGTALAGAIPGSALSARSSTVRWRGVAMGAQAELIVNHPDQREAEAAMRLVLGEIRRLEKVFSLYDQESSLSRLNQQGVLHMPAPDLVRCMGDAAHISEISNGAFDVTVQPLWDLYSQHFKADPTSAQGPSQLEIATARGLVNYRAVEISLQSLRFTKPGMGVTLNGIAQGYITDRVADLLKANGFENVLIDLGETRGVGQREDGSPWRIGIKAPDTTGILLQKVSLRDKAIATSGGYGTRFSTNGNHHHLFDPRTGQSARYWDSVSVIADDATRADALSTAFSSLPEPDIREIAETLNVSVIAVEADRTVSISI